jgi:hypothetical protein
MNMKLTIKLTALSLVICTSMIPLAAQADHKYKTGLMFINNFSTEEQNLSSEINSYVSSGRITPQRGSSFTNELNRISIQARSGGNSPAAAAQVMNEFNNLAAHINSSLGATGQYAATPVNGASRQVELNQAAAQKQLQGHEERNRAAVAAHATEAHATEAHATEAHATEAHATEAHATEAHATAAPTVAAHATAAPATAAPVQPPVKTTASKEHHK